MTVSWKVQSIDGWWLMTRVLVLCDSLPSNPADGLHLRIQNLCLELSRYNECFFLGSKTGHCDDHSFDRFGFSEGYLLGEKSKRRRGWRRHIRLSNEKFLEMSSPEYFRAARSALTRLSNLWSADVLVSFASAMSEVGALSKLPKVLDFPDSGTLTRKRAHAISWPSMSTAEKSMALLRLKRQAGGERALVRKYDLTTTISEPDREALLGVSGVADDRVVIVPNGVSRDALTVGETPTKHDRSVVFWGNLDFPPNFTAIRYFYEKVFTPYLADKNIDWHIVGGGAGESLHSEVRHPRIHFHGFVDDLFASAAGYGVMVNPMIQGSGLKNKVLESFALNLPVVSTPLGVEAIDGKAGVHYLVAETPRQFAEGVERLLDDRKLRMTIIQAGRSLAETRYTWPSIGAQFSDLIRKVSDEPETSRNLMRGSV